MAGYVDPFEHRHGRDVGREPSEGTDELELDVVVDLTEGITDEIEAGRQVGSGRSAR
jgi:hypothetical protein